MVSIKISEVTRGHVTCQRGLPAVTCQARALKSIRVICFSFWLWIAL